VGPLFNAALVFVALAFVAGVTFIISRFRGRAVPQAAMEAAAFCLGAVCAAAAAAFLGALVMGPGAVLHSRLQVFTYLGYLVAAACFGGVGLITVVARRSNNRLRGP